MNQEIELKLELPREAVEAFERSSLISDVSERAELSAIYFDTPDRRLRDQGYSLRIRRCGDKRVQTVKADHGEGGGGLFARAEWEMPVADDQPVIDTRTPLAAALGDAVESIELAFHVDVERRTWILEEQAGPVEMILDKGCIRAGEREAPIFEIELELKTGDPSTLFALARRIDAVVPVRLGVAAKAERGYRLLDAAPASFKAEPVDLEPGSDPIQAFRIIARACVRQYRLNEALLIDNYHPDALHQARVAIRRLRSALTFFKPLLEAQQAVRFQDELRWLAQLMGEARDLDVLVEAVEAGDLHEQLKIVRERAHANVLEALGSRRVRGLMIEFSEWLTLGAVRPSVGRSVDAFAADRLQHFYRWVVKHGRHMAKLDDEHRHAVRKKAKKLRYASEFFGILFCGTKKNRKRHASFIDALEALQEKLGALNDRVNWPDLLKRYSLDISKQTGAFGAKGRKKLVAVAAKAHADLADTKPFWR